MNRISQSVIKKGEYCMDACSTLEREERNYAFYAPWGYLYIKCREQCAAMFRLSAEPEWGEVEEWLDALQIELSASYANTENFSSRVMAGLRENWERKRGKSGLN